MVAPDTVRIVFRYERTRTTKRLIRYNTAYLSFMVASVIATVDMDAPGASGRYLANINTMAMRAHVISLVAGLLLVNLHTLLAELVTKESWHHRLDSRERWSNARAVLVRFSPDCRWRVASK